MSTNALWHVVERDSDLHVEALPDGPHVCNVGRVSWPGVREMAARIVADHNAAVAWRTAHAHGTADGWRVALRSGDEIAVDVCNAFDATPLADCDTAEQFDYMRATARLHEGAAPATADGRCDGNLDGDSVVGYVAAELLMRKYDIAEILPPGEVPRAALLDELARLCAESDTRAEIGAQLARQVASWSAECDRLRALARQPAPDAPDVAAIGARASSIADAAQSITLTPWSIDTTPGLCGHDVDRYHVLAAPESAVDVVALVPRVEGAEADAAFIVLAVNEAAALAADNATLLAWIAAEPARVAVAVADEVRRERDMWQAQIETTTTDAAAALDMVDDLVRHAVLHHPLPWRIEDDWTREVTAADGTIIAKCMTHERAAAIIAAAEKIRADLDAPMRDTCGKPATCRGEYEGEAGHACDDCCGHGNEDGHCEPVGAAPAQEVG